MIEKKYYRYDELERRFNLSFSDLQYLVENYKIDLVFLIEQNQFIIGDVISKKGFVGQASVTCRGLIKIAHFEQMELITKRKIKCTYFRLFDNKTISNFSVDYPFVTPLPHSTLYDWKPKKRNEITWSDVSAKLLPTEREPILDTMKNIFFEGIDNLTENSSTEENDFTALKAYSASMKTSPKLEFFCADIKFTLNDICLLHSDLVRLNIIPSPSPFLDGDVIHTPKQHKLPTSKNTLVFDNDFHELLAGILRVNKALPAKKIFKILTEESLLEEDTRHYDIKNILLDEVDGILIWKDRLSRTHERKCSLRTLENTLSKIRAVISEANLSDKSLKASQNHS